MISISIFSTFSSFFDSIKNFFSMPSYTPSFDRALEFINFVAYFVPIHTIVTVFLVWVAINVISFVIRIIKTVWELIPIV